MNEKNLHPYQKKAVKHILENPYCGLFLDMGLGKTVITLTAVNTLLYDALEVSRVLVVAPLRVAQSTWIAEATKWEHLAHLRVSRVLGTISQRETALKADADIYVINRENVPWLEDYLTNKKKNLYFDMLVIDELSSFKSPSSKRFKKLRLLRAGMKRVVGLTGTPAPNSYLDLWSQLYLLDKGERLGKTVTSYRNRYFYPAMSNGYVVYKYDLKQGAGEIIKELISDICMSMRAEDFLNLPELVINDIPVLLSDTQKVTYKRLERDKLISLQDAEVTALTAANTANKLLQLANGAIYDDAGQTVWVHDEKLNALSDIIEAANGQSILIFYNYRHDLKRLQDRFSVSVLEGEQDLLDWNDGKINLLAAHPASMGHGLNMQAGGHIIVWFGLTWSLEQYQQANARLYRQGQTKSTIIHRLVAKNTIDEDVIKRLDMKKDAQDSLLDMLKARLNK